MRVAAADGSFSDFESWAFVNFSGSVSSSQSSSTSQRERLFASSSLILACERPISALDSDECAGDFQFCPEGFVGSVDLSHRPRAETAVGDELAQLLQRRLQVVHDRHRTEVGDHLPGRLRDLLDCGLALLLLPLAQVALAV